MDNKSVVRDPLPLPPAYPLVTGLVFDVPEVASYVAHLRKAVRGLLRSRSISESDTNALETVIGELATNALRHGGGGNYLVSMELHGDQATSTVADKGIGFDLEQMPEPGTAPPGGEPADGMWRTGGFGLPSPTDHVNIQRR